MLRVRCPKPGRTHLWPLSQSVGHAILRYIREARPSGFGRSLFFTTRAPIRPLDRSALGKMVRDRLADIGVVSGRRGAHALRHAAAQHLLDQGTSMKVIGDFLGHRDPSSTTIYAKVDLAALRKVAALDLEGGMTLREATEQYILWRQAHGAKFTNSAGLLRGFVRHAGTDTPCNHVNTAQILAFLAGHEPLTRTRENKYYALVGFWRYAISRGYASRSPLPANVRSSPERAPPYIYSRDELARLLDPPTVETSRCGAVQLDAVTFRTLLILLYGAGLCYGEASRLTLADVDLTNAVLTIRATKFFKSRLVPVGPQLAAMVGTHVSQRRARNQRLAAIRAFARFVGSRDPSHVEWCGHIRAIASKRCMPPPVGWLTRAEMEAVLAVPDRKTRRGRSEYALLLFLYNTGARVSEASHLKVCDLQIGSRNGGHHLATLHGKGGRTRHCPLWPETERVLADEIAGRGSEDAVFVSRLGTPFTRFGVYRLIERCAAQVPALAGRTVSPHVIRHTTACHLVLAGVDINTIRAWLGHHSISTTNIYAEIDLTLKANAVALCEVGQPRATRSWKEDKDLMAFLRAL